MDAIIAKIRKNTREDIWITRGPYRGKDTVHVRIYYRDTLGVFATRKGIAISATDVSKLVTSINRALDGDVSEQQPAVIAKTARERVHVYAAEFMAQPLIQLRIYFYSEEDASWKPSPKGVAIKPDLIPLLIDALNAAERVTASSFEKKRESVRKL